MNAHALHFGRLTSMAAVLLIAALIAALAGCAGPADGGDLDAARSAYARGQYQSAYNTAARIAEQSGTLSDEAAYFAGLSLQRMDRPAQAQPYLERAARSTDRGLANAASAALGVLHHQAGRHQAAAETLEGVADQLSGEERANAYFYAGIARQKLDQWAPARRNFVLARSATSDTGMRRQVEQRLSVTGYRIQVGAFSDRGNAQRAAQQIASQAQALGLGAPQLVNGTSQDGGRLILVQVGQFSSYSTAQSARRRLDAPQSMVVPISSR